MYFSKFMPETIITSDIQELRLMEKKYKQLVLKTLYLKGGEGVCRVSSGSAELEKKFTELLETYKVPVVVQRFLDEVSKGDKRILLINGNPVGAINRIPMEGKFKANLHLGGKAEVTRLSKKEERICKSLKEIILKERLFFVGLDLIDEKLTEINVTSPTGIIQIYDLYGKNLSDDIWLTLLKKYY